MFADLLWAIVMIRARRWRRSILPSQHIAFDELLRHRFPVGYIVEHADSFYGATFADLRRAIDGTRELPKSRYSRTD
jgi:hypothetical protein